MHNMLESAAGGSSGNSLQRGCTLAASIVLLLVAACGSARAAPSETGEVAFAAPAGTAPADTPSSPAPCASPCWVPGDTYPFPSCKQTCDDRCQSGGTGVYQSREVCCSPGVAFPGGCVQRPSACWVVESFALHTCVRDDRKCLQGSVFGSESACCAPGAAFPDGCAAVPLSAAPCWIVDQYWPARQCRSSRTLCGPDAGVQSFSSREACCARGGAFPEGCSTYTPVTPCWTIDSYYPERTCIQSSDVAVCNRGWGVFQSQEVCCARGTAFPEGCSSSAAANTTGPAAQAAASPAPSPQPAVQPSTQAAAGPASLVQPANTTTASPATTPSQSPIIVSTTPLPAAANSNTTLSSTNATTANGTSV